MNHFLVKFGNLLSANSDRAEVSARLQNAITSLITLHEMYTTRKLNFHNNLTIILSGIGLVFVVVNIFTMGLFSVPLFVIHCTPIRHPMRSPFVVGLELQINETL